MKHNIEAILETAGKVHRLRVELALAEAEFEKVAGVKLKPLKSSSPVRDASPRTPRQPVSAAPVSQIVAKALEGERKYAFGELVAMAGGRDKKFAVKSALIKLREKGVVKFGNGLYFRASAQKKVNGKSKRTEEVTQPGV